MWCVGVACWRGACPIPIVVRSADALAVACPSLALVAFGVARVCFLALRFGSLLGWAALGGAASGTELPGGSSVMVWCGCQRDAITSLAQSWLAHRWRLATHRLHTRSLCVLALAALLVFSQLGASCSCGARRGSGSLSAGVAWQGGRSCGCVGELWVCIICEGGSCAGWRDAPPIGR